MKNALLKGIPLGLLIALVIIGARTFLGEAGFVENLCSLYGILTIICFPLGFALWFNYGQKKKGK